MPQDVFLYLSGDDNLIYPGFTVCACNNDTYSIVEYQIVSID